VKCEGRLLLTDTAMSRWMGGGKPSALFLETDDTTGALERIYIKHSRGMTMDVPILDALNTYPVEL